MFTVIYILFHRNAFIVKHKLLLAITLWGLAEKFGACVSIQWHRFEPVIVEWASSKYRSKTCFKRFSIL